MGKKGRGKMCCAQDGGRVGRWVGKWMSREGGDRKWGGVAKDRAGGEIR